MAFLYRYMHLFEYNFVFMYKGVVLVDKTKLLLFYTIHFVRHYFTLSLWQAKFKHYTLCFQVL